MSPDSLQDNDAREDKEPEHEVSQPALKAADLFSGHTWETYYEAFDQPIFILDPQYTLLAANPAARDLAEMSEQELIGRKCYELFHDSKKPPEDCPVDKLRASSRPLPHKRKLEAFGKPCTVTCTSILDKNNRLKMVVQTFMDITETREAQLAWRRAVRSREIIKKWKQTILYATGEQSLMEEACRMSVEDAGYKLAWIGAAEDDEKKTIRPVAQWGRDEGYLKMLNLTWADTERGRGPIGTAIRTGKPSIVNNILFDTRYILRQAEVVKRGFVSLAAFPLIIEGRAWGALNLYAGEPGVFDQEELGLFSEVTRDLAFGLENLRNRTERDRTEKALRESEEKYRRLFENTGIALAIIEEDMTISMANKEFERLSGYTIKEVQGKNKWTEFIVKEDLERIQQYHRERRKKDGRAPASYEFRFIDRQGNVREILVRARMIPGTTQTMASLRDITERKRAERELRKSEEILRVITNNVTDIIWMTDLEGKVTFISPSVERVLGYTVQEVLGTNVTDRLTPAERREVFANYRKNLEEGRFSPRAVERELICKDGSTKQCEVVHSWMLDENGDPVGFVGVARDITERKRVERELRKRDETLRIITENITDIIWLTDLEGKVTFISPSVERVLGYTVQEVLGFNITNTLSPADREAAFAIYRKNLEEGRFAPWAEERELICKDGSTKQCEVVHSWMLDENGGPVGLVGVARDITERKRAERELRKSEERYRTILESINEGYFETDLRGRLTFFNEALRKMLGYTREELMTMDNRDYSSPETAKKTFQVFRRIYETGKPAKLMDFETITKDGSVRYHEISASLMQNPEGQPIGFRGVARDITDKKRMEEEKEVLERQLRHAQTMEVIGTLAAGIAHDFNNILSSIIGYTELALEDLPEGASVQSDMKQVLNAGLRAKDLVKQLLSFSREEKQEFQPVRVSAVIEEALKFIMQTIPSNIEIRQNISAKTERVWADPAEIHRVVINLCVNAAYAMREKGGILEVDLVKVDLEDPLVVRRLNVQPGPYLKLTVRDTGEGIEAVNLDRIFDPYFTTKQRTEGTGLGLAVVHGVVESCGGAITVQSKLGEGATFDVFLPVITGGEESVREVTAQQPGEKKARILFVDDEEPIATLAKRTLERLGYRVEVRTSSLEVLEVFRARPDQFDLVITDYMMPNMTGVKLAEEIKRIRRDVPIILCTGYSETVAQEQAESIGIREILMKPLVREEITRAIQDALDPE